MESLSLKSEAEISKSLLPLLQGNSLGSEDIDVIKFDEDGYIPITKKTVTYIVAAVLFDADDRILLVQEAKASCYGKWYLPAGRLEPNETFEEGVIREVKEEAGLVMEPTGLLSVDVSCVWYRIVFLGRVVGGTLKGYDQRDAESLQAQWFRLEDIKRVDFPRRANDMLKVIDRAVTQHKTLTRPSNLRPTLRPHHDLILRIFAVDISGFSESSTTISVLLRHSGTSTATNAAQQQQQQQQQQIGAARQLPCVRLSSKVNLYTAVRKLLVKAISISCGDQKSNSRFLEPTFHGVLSIEHSASQVAKETEKSSKVKSKEKPGKEKPTSGNSGNSCISDGMCITVLVSVSDSHNKDSPESQKSKLTSSEGFHFMEIGSESVLKEIKPKILQDYIVPLVLL